VSVVVPTLNEGDRIAPCLQGLSQQGAEIREVLIVDSCSTDDTLEKVRAARSQDMRFRATTDDPLPPGWVGRPWALHTGFLQVEPESSWILGIDADTQPQPGLVAGLLHAAETENYDLVTLSPRFILKHWGEALLQPALLTTLVYRFGATGDDRAKPERMLANGQCCLVRKHVLEQLGGYSLARQSFCDDVTLVRAAARQGFRVGFWDGSHVIQVRMYETAAETWREWGRSLDLKDAATPLQTWSDAFFLLAVQGLPLPLLAILLTAIGGHWEMVSWFTLTLLSTNVMLSIVRWSLLVAIAGAYLNPPLAFWLSPLVDPAAVLRIWLSARSRPKVWRGRKYEAVDPSLQS
jgi:dolichol-phosphate mannosyltransferase